MISISFFCSFIEVIFSDTVCSTLQSVCRAYPAVAEEHLISPTLTELDTDPSRAWLLAFLSPTPSLAVSVLPALISFLQHLLNSSSLCDGTALSEQYWGKVLPLSSALLDVIKSNTGSAALTLSSVNSLVLLSQQAADMHWKCCTTELCRFIENISVSFSHNARHATDRLLRGCWVWC